jgi:hypothetical protein
VPVGPTVAQGGQLLSGDGQAVVVHRLNSHGIAVVDEVIRF